MNKVIKPRPIHLWVCWCHLISNERMTSSYLVRAVSKREAKKMMSDGEHIVDDIQAFGEYFIECGWVSLTVEEENNFERYGTHCIEAGT